jgi:hypothetical protein
MHLNLSDRFLFLDMMVSIKFIISEVVFNTMTKACVV